MGGPIVSPWFIYFVEVINVLRSIVAIVFATFLFIASMNYVRERIRIRHVVFWAALFLLSTLIPTKKTVIEMFVAQNVTYERVKIAQKEAKKIHDIVMRDILKLIDKINDKGKEVPDE